MVEIVTVEEAVGQPLAHDIAAIVHGKHKGAAFRRAHVVKAGDIEVLPSLGKNHIYILKPESYQMHEDDAATAIAEVSGSWRSCALPHSWTRVHCGVRP